jgi:hypothetical protein
MFNSNTFGMMVATKINCPEIIEVIENAKNNLKGTW